ncbi:unnamed protein product [Ceratitis capitata]|uniref:(Mediterranean fruit fly) hypothetical protein n=5 Tax=Ceratitis capitata TaxID=7213 RepID=A0A811U440_CERCA|nr:unnamed protein product [Ceratitis capitata]
MIGGPCVLPSPPFGPVVNNDSCADTCSSEVSPSSVTPVDAESTSDSGIDDICVMETSSIKLQLDKSKELSVKPITGCSAATKDMLLMKCLNNKAIKNRASMGLAASETQLKQQQFPPQPAAERIDGAAAIGIINDCGNSKGSVKTSSDNINPLMEPFIMELCNDDYDVPTEPFLGPNEIDHVLNDWAHEMA